MDAITSHDLYVQYRQQMQKIADVRYSLAVLQWDQETYLPAKGADFRARQLATLSEIAHEMFTSYKVGTLLQELLLKDLPEGEKRNIELTWEDHSRLKKLSRDFVRKMSEAVSASFYAWLEARKLNDFKIFEPKLAPLVELKRQEAELYGYKAHPYDALMNEYEKGAPFELLGVPAIKVI